MVTRLVAGLFNPHTGNGFSQAVIFLNALGAGCALGYNAVAALRSPQPYRQMHAAIGSLAAVYVVGYTWLLGSDVPVPVW